MNKEICSAILNLLDRVDLKGKQEARVMVTCEQALIDHIKILEEENGTKKQNPTPITKEINAQSPHSPYTG